MAFEKKVRQAARELSSLTIKRITLDESLSVPISDNDKDEFYKKTILEASGLSSFSHFVFVQSFILTFDERRCLLFWNPGIMQTCLDIIFGGTATHVAEADKLRKEISRLDSIARNEVWQARGERKQAETLSNVIGEHKNDELDEEKLHEYERLNTTKCELQEEIDSKLKVLNDVNLKYEASFSKYDSLRSQYEDLFNQSFSNKQIAIEQHPLIKEVLKNHSCYICGCNDKSVIARISSAISENSCPACGNKIVSNPVNDDILVQLKEIDKEINDLKKEQVEYRQQRGRLTTELETSKQTLQECDNQIKALLDQYDFTGFKTDGPSAKISEEIKNHQKRATELEDFAKERRKERDKKQKQVKELNLKIEKQYRIVEAKFVPSFRSLAENFLGIDLDIALETNGAKNISFYITVDNAARREDFQLSESQRFFVDIALRMAIIKFLSPNKSVSLLIDTPEGALDIAYEAKAGEMFAKFTNEGKSIIMTVNINSSQLLLSLASLTTAQNMNLYQMTDWATLSDVQDHENKRFADAIEKIKQCLKP